MKKYLIALLALAMMFTLAVPVLAEVTPDGNAEQDVTAGYIAATDTDSGTVYRVTIAWHANAGETALSYTGKQSTYTWDTEGLVYKETVDTAAGWTGETGYTVTVTNYSNAAVKASVEATNTYNLTLTRPENESADLGSAAVSEGKDIAFTDTKTKGEAKAMTFDYTYKAAEDADAPAEDSASTVSVGKITVTIAGN